MDKAKLEQLIELHKEGQGAVRICRTIGQSKGIVSWHLAFLNIHGEHELRLYNEGIGRPSYSKAQILGIYNFVLRTHCSFDRAEVYFKIRRNKLLEKVKRYIGKENIGKEVPDAVLMIPKLGKDCDQPYQS